MRLTEKGINKGGIVMKYIRTTDGRIIDTNSICIGNNENDFKSIEHYLEVSEQIVAKQSDTIEELCDEFVYKILTDEIEEPIYRDVHNARIDIKTQLKIYEDNMISVCAIYGAIWTDKGLIYVAKMNERGEFELL